MSGPQEERDIRGEPLTPREQEVLDKIGEAKPNKIIAYELGISETTVKSIVCRLLLKLRLTNRVELALTAHGIEWRKAA